MWSSNHHSKSFSILFYYTYIYNFEIKCYIVLVAALEIIYIYQSYGTLIKFNILKCMLLLYYKQYSLDNNQCI